MQPARALVAVVVVMTALALPASAAASHAGPLAGQWHLDQDTSGAAE